MSCRRAGGTLQCQCSLRKQRIFHSYNPSNQMKSRTHPQKGVLNRRFKRLFGDFFAAEKVTPPAGGNSCEEKLTIRRNQALQRAPRRGEGENLQEPLSHGFAVPALPTLAPAASCFPSVATSGALRRNSLALSATGGASLISPFQGAPLAWRGAAPISLPLSGGGGIRRLTQGD